jgi:glycosyltransferase involved in cell wall biosynthesis
MLVAYRAGPAARRGKKKLMCSCRSARLHQAVGVADCEPMRPTSFLIPAYNEEVYIGRAVLSVHGAAAACGLSGYEVIVCDNASTDRTAVLAREAGAQVVDEPHRQIARARNAAADASTGDWLVWLDADAMLTPEVLAATLEALAGGKVCGGGALVELEGVPLTWTTRATIAAWNWVARTFHFAAGSYFFAQREGWAATGGFNERVYAGEELGFARELKRWGRERKLDFAVILRAVPSSARKVGQFTTWEAIRLLAVCAWPGNRGRRDRCAFWYERPPEVEG